MAPAPTGYVTGTARAGGSARWHWATARTASAFASAFAKTRTAISDKRAELHKDLDSGISQERAYTLGNALDEWLARGQDGRSPETIGRNRALFYSSRRSTTELRPVFTIIFGRKLRELSARDVHATLTSLAADHSTATLSLIHNCIVRAIRHAEARDLVARNVATLIRTPKGNGGRPSRALSAGQATALLQAAEGTRMRAYIILSLLARDPHRGSSGAALGACGLRRPGRRGARLGGHVALCTARRGHQDREVPPDRTLALSQLAAGVLWDWKLAQAEERAEAGERWTGTGLVFTTSAGTAMDAANVRRDFRAVCKAAGVGETWTPRELRHSFVSLMSNSGVPVEEIARLAGHSSSRTTEVVYRNELRPVLQTGAVVMDEIFRPKP